MTSTQSRPVVTVIVPVWNGEDCIGPCLEALVAQNYPRDRLEIIAVDNGSTDGTAAIIRSIPGVVYLSEPEAGSYKARNSGLDIAKGDAIAFLDADCTADANWIAAGVAAIDTVENLGILAGKVEITAVEGASRPVFLYEKFFSFRQFDLAKAGKCVTANWMSPRHIFDTVGRFDARLKSGGDWLLSSQISGAGHAVAYVPDMIVRHPARSAMDELLGKRRRVAGGEWVKAAGRRSVLGMVGSACKDGLKKAVRVIRAGDFSASEKLLILYVLARATISYSVEILRLAAGAEPRRS